MARKYKVSSEKGGEILLVDDNLEYLEATRLLLSREGHNVTTAPGGAEALAILEKKSFDLILLDYFMPGMTGEEFVSELRKKNKIIQIILQTGYASEHPPRELLRRLDIQGYFDKSEGPDRLLLWVEVGLKSANSIKQISKSRESLNYILNVTPDLHRIQPLEELLNGILIQIMGLLGVGNSFLAVFGDNNSMNVEQHEDSFLAMMDDEAGLIIQAGTGRFNPKHHIKDFLEGNETEIIGKALNEGIVYVKNGRTAIPLRVADYNVGVVYVDREISLEDDVSLLSVFANQAAVAIHNSRLHQIATIDPLTGVYVRGFFFQCLLRDLRGAFRNNYPLVLMMVDIDNLKIINDEHGHIAGDQAIALIGRSLLKATRNTDAVGRYGGDEFTVLLPQTNLDSVEIILNRFYRQLEDNPINGDAEPLTIRCSIGVGLLDSPDFDINEMPKPIPQSYFQKMAESFIDFADHVLYKAKTNGKNRFMMSENTLKWNKDSDQ
ncbi:MAG TPA: diguanylate cyclase [Spirochaetota bacterium]|nr:diguanylate cyclase [Spirochaetota bacterium]HOR44162.1 diguanylate cyclase [Spirochaetota bacterium]HPK55124.1 diguanylate cyclase [Spirochaetota bacterium]